MPLRLGTILKNCYRIDRALGQGGMGAVYEAYDVNLGVKVAVKENLFTTEEFARQFRREATILASLRHPNLPRVTDHFVIEKEGQHLVMDFIDGVDLRERLETEGSISEEEALPWFLAISDALSYLHSRKPPILHRDIKPGNIKIMPSGRAMLVDFGLAKVAEEGDTTSTGAKAMTPGFSPPEQYGTGRTDSRTDVYSLGATLYAILTAAIPEDLIQRAMGREKLTPVRKRNPEVSSGVAKVIEKALAVHPDDRYQSVQKMAIALSSASGASHPTVVRSYPYLESTRVASGKDVGADLVTRKYKSAARVRRLSKALLLVLPLALIAVGAKFVVPDLGPRLVALLARPTAGPTLPDLLATDTIDIQPTQTEDFTLFPITPSPEVTEEPIIVPTSIGTATPTQPPTATPQGGGVGQVAYVSGKSGNPQIYLINVDGTGERQLTNREEGACQPAWSPNGLQLVFTSPCQSDTEEYPGSSLWLISFNEEDNISDQIPLQTLPGGGGDYDPAWAPDGEQIAFTSRRDGRSQVYIMNLDGTGLVNLNEDLAYNRQPAWSPDGKRILFTTSRARNKEIWIMPDYGGDEAAFSRSDGEDDSFADWSGDGELILFQREIGSIPILVAARFSDQGRIDFRICPEGRYAGYPMAEPKWSPDGNWIIFETWPDGRNHNIAFITWSCTDFAEITNHPAEDFDPAWRPMP